MFGMIVVGLVCREAICVYFETVLRMNIRASRAEGKYIRALMVVDLAGLSFSTLCACLTPLLCYPCCPCCPCCCESGREGGRAAAIELGMRGGSGTWIRSIGAPVIGL